MTVKFKKKRRLWLNSISLIIVIAFIYSVWNFLTNDSDIWLMISFVFQVVFWLGMIGFQAVKYDDEKVIAQFGWPRIKYTDIISIEKKFGDILIKSAKRDIGINKDIVDEESLNQFLEHLKKKIPEPVKNSLNVF